MNLRKSSFEALVSTRHWRGGWLSCPVSALSLTWTLSQFPSDHHHRIWWHKWSRVTCQWCHVSRVPVVPTCQVYQWCHASRVPVMSRVPCQWWSRVTYASDAHVSRVSDVTCHVSHMPVMSPCRSLICLLAAWGHGLPSYGRGGDGDNRDQCSVGSILNTRAKIKSLSIKHKAEFW